MYGLQYYCNSTAQDGQHATAVDRVLPSYFHFFSDPSPRLRTTNTRNEPCEAQSPRTQYPALSAHYRANNQSLTICDGAEVVPRDGKRNKLIYHCCSRWEIGVLVPRVLSVFLAVSKTQGSAHAANLEQPSPRNHKQAVELKGNMTNTSTTVVVS